MTRVRESADRTYLGELVAPLVADVRRSLDTGYQISFDECEGEWEWTSWWSNVSSSTSASVAESVFNAEMAEARLSLVQEILDFDFDEVLEPWPACPFHGDHPLSLTSREKVVWWMCGRTGQGVARLGILKSN